MLCIDQWRTQAPHPHSPSHPPIHPPTTPSHPPIHPPTTPTHHKNKHVVQLSAWKSPRHDGDIITWWACWGFVRPTTGHTIIFINHAHDHVFYFSLWFSTAQLKLYRSSYVSNSNKPISQIPRCICPISHNPPICNRNVHTCAHFRYKMMHCAIFLWHIVGLYEANDIHS